MKRRSRSESWSLAVRRGRTRSIWPWWRQRRGWQPPLPRFVSPTRRASATSRWSGSGIGEAGLTAEIEPFLYDMGRRLREADLIVSRAGATTLAEITAAGKPAILIPLPTATDDHQRKNAEALARVGSGGHVATGRSDGAGDGGRILALAGERERGTGWGGAAATLARPDAARVIVDRALALVGHLA